MALRPGPPGAGRRALTFAGLGVAIGFVTTILAFLVLGGLTAPGASAAGLLGPALQASAVAAAASLIGWLLAQAPGRIARRPRQRAA